MIGNGNFYWNGNQGTYPFPVGAMIDYGTDTNAKQNEDQYEVYVNQQLIGVKTLKNSVDKLGDVDEFLRRQGLTNFTSSLDGNHYEIHTDVEMSQDIASALSVYFHNR